MINKSIELTSVNRGAAMPAGDKQLPHSVKKVALRDLPNETRNAITKPLGNSSLPKGRGTVAEPQKVSGMKRYHPDWPPSPAHHQSTCNNSTNGHLVYVRRKLETDVGKISTSDEDDTAISPKPRNFRNSEKKESNYRQDQVQEPRVSCFPAFSPIPAASLSISSQGPSVPYSLGTSMTGLSVMEQNCPMISTGMPVLVSTRTTSNLHWKERFIRLQEFLKSCDQSNQEEHIQMLRSLSAVGRSKHAVDLEKRAIHLLLEEGEELRRMKVLNVLGKVCPN